MNCDAHKFDPSRAWGKPIYETQEFELEVECLNCGKHFHFREPLQEVVAHCLKRQKQREIYKRTGMWVEF